MGDLPGTAMNVKKASFWGHPGASAPCASELLACGSFLGHCWCVDGMGDYVPASLTARSTQGPRCK